MDAATSQAMATLDQLLSKCQDRLRPDIDYTLKLHAGKYETPQDIAQERKISRLIQACGLDIEDGVIVWEAARAFAGEGLIHWNH